MTAAGSRRIWRRGGSLRHKARHGIWQQTMNYYQHMDVICVYLLTPPSDHGRWTGKQHSQGAGSLKTGGARGNIGDTLLTLLRRAS